MTYLLTHKTDQIFEWFIHFEIVNLVQTAKSI